MPHIVQKGTGEPVQIGDIVTVRKYILTDDGTKVEKNIGTLWFWVGFLDQDTRSKPTYAYGAVYRGNVDNIVQSKKTILSNTQQQPNHIFYIMYIMSNYEFVVWVVPTNSGGYGTAVWVYPKGVSVCLILRCGLINPLVRGYNPRYCWFFHTVVLYGALRLSPNAPYRFID